MIAQRLTLLLSALALAGCGERLPRNEAGGGSTTPPYVRAEENSLLGEASQPVRVGELGPGFAACPGRGAVRERPGAAAAAIVRAAPFEATREVDRLPAGAEFFICARTHDQRWFGIVYDDSGDGERCNVSAPATRRRAYPGPCDSGWVASAQVRLISGVPHQLPPVAENRQVPPPAPTP